MLYIAPYKSVKFRKIYISVDNYLSSCMDKEVYIFFFHSPSSLKSWGELADRIKNTGPVVMWRPLHGCCQTQRTKDDTNLNNTQFTHYSLRGATDAYDMTPRTPEWCKTQKGVYKRSNEFKRARYKPSRSVFVRMIYAEHVSSFILNCNYQLFKKKSEEQQTLYFIVFILNELLLLYTVDFSFCTNVKFILKNIWNKGIEEDFCEAKWTGRHVDNIYIFCPI